MKMRSSKLMRTLVSLIVLAISVMTVSAELRWERMVFQHTAVPGEKEITAAFAFENIGKTPVEIKSLRSSCGCTTAALAKKRYEPGERGSIEVRFVYGWRSGLQRKSVSVFLADQDGPPAVLAMEVQLPESVSIEPSELVWKLGEEPVARELRLKSESIGRAKIARASVSAPEDWVIQVKEGQNGREAYVVVQPKTTAAPRTSQVMIEVAGDSAKTLVVPVRVKR